MELEGSDAAEVRIGEFSISKGKYSSASTAADKYEAMALEELKDIGRRCNYVQTL